MKNNSMIQMMKFTFFSISAGVIQVISFAIFNDLLKWIYWPSYLSALILSIIWNFTLNRQYTFKSTANIPVAMIKLFGFYIIFTPMSTWLGHIAESIGINDYIILSLTMISNFLLEFLYCKFIIYKDQENTRQSKWLIFNTLESED